MGDSHVELLQWRGVKGTAEESTEVARVTPVNANTADARADVEVVGETEMESNAFAAETAEEAGHFVGGGPDALSAHSTARGPHGTHAVHRHRVR